MILLQRRPHGPLQSRESVFEVEDGLRRWPVTHEVGCDVTCPLWQTEVQAQREG
jgi:hypothetical protein